MSGPLQRNGQGKPVWANPCGPSRDPDDPDTPPPSRSNIALLEPLLIVSKNALVKAEQFSTEWVGKTFHSGVRDHHSMWNHRGYDWLPSKEEIPKNLGEDLSPQVLEQLNNKSLDETLKVIYRNLQIYAVGLEQAHEDQKHYQDGWVHQFLTMQNENTVVLCELSSVLLELDGSLELEVIGRDVMAEDYRKDNSASSRNLRDWFILRDFMTTLEYLIEVCTFFSQQQQQ